jgi:adenylate kinase family enzyme
VQSGAYWRRLQKAKTKEGAWLRRTTAKGKPAPVSLMKKFITRSVEECPKGKSAIFVGNPRLKPEAQLLLKLLTKRNENVRAFYITLPKKEIYRRSLLRIRNADDAKHIQERVSWHKNQVSKTVSYLKTKKILKTINGNQSVKAVTQDLLSDIKKWQKAFMVK